jgi:hypothetical protein
MWKDKENMFRVKTEDKKRCKTNLASRFQGKSGSSTRHLKRNMVQK